MSDTARRALVIEDDVALAHAIADILRDELFAVTLAHDGEAGVRVGLSETFDVIVLDIMLPKRNGFSVCADLRREGVQTPLLMLTAKEGELDEIEGLEVGADDFLRKPFERAILVARVHALLRRHERGRPQAYEVGAVRLDPLTRTVTANAQPVNLTPREFTLLEFLMSRSPRAVTKAEILETVWGEDFGGDPNILEVYVGYLRRKVDLPSTASIIRTVRGVGYACAEPA